MRNEFQGFYFLSNDDIFQKKAKALKDEFFSQVGKTVEILNPDNVEAALKLLVPAAKSETDSQAECEESTNEELQPMTDEEAKNTVRDIIDKFLFVECFNEEDEITYKEPTFYLKRGLYTSEVTSLLNSLMQRKSSFLFYKTVDISAFLKDIGIESTQGRLADVQNVLNLIDLWEEIGKADSDISKAFVSYFRSIINSDTFLKDDDQDLPF
jgi:hypothetical protein